MNPISAILVIKGNPPHTIESLDSIQNFVSEIIVADIGIDEELKSKLSSYPRLRYVDISDPVPYVEVIREKLKVQAKQDYVLFLDPDEILPEQLINDLTRNLQKTDYFSIPRKNIIFGKWIQHSRWWPDYQIRLFKKDNVKWPTTIHSQPLVSGKEHKIPMEETLAMIHHNYISIDEYFSKAMRYAKGEAHSWIKENRPMTFASSLRKSISEFISRFFADEGYRDGMHGFILAFFQMIYPLLVYFYYLEIKKFSYPETEKELIHESVGFFARLHKESLFWKNKKSSSTIKEKIVEKFIS